MALDEPELSPRELAVRFTDTGELFRLGSFGLSPAQGPRPDHQPGLHRHQGGRRVQGQDHRPQPALADRLHLPQGHRLGLVLSVDHPRRLLALHHRLEAVHDHAGRATSPTRWSWRSPPRAAISARVVHKPRLLSDNGSSYVAGDLAEWLEDKGIDHVRGAPCHPQTQGKIERWHQTLKNRILLENYYLPGDLEAPDRRLRRPLQSPPLPREPRQPHPGRRLLRTRPDHPAATRKDQTKDHRTATLAPSQGRSLKSTTEMSQSLRSISAANCLKFSDDGHSGGIGLCAPQRGSLWSPPRG